MACRTVTLFLGKLKKDYRVDERFPSISELPQLSGNVIGCLLYFSESYTDFLAYTPIHTFC